MPHIIVKLYPGRTEDLKKTLAKEITKTLIKVLNSKDSAISVGIEDVEPTEWAEKVHQPDIVLKINTIYKRSSN
jgi:4-oxalocrotonate tautomerase